MGAAICGMHYTGMAAAHFADGSICTTADGIEKVSLVYGVILTTGLLLMAAIGSTILDAHLSEHRKLSTTLARRDEQFSRLAHHDHLTGLPNRSQLKDYLSAALAKAQRHGRGLAVLLLDLDGFKGVNDQWGPAAGDWVLQEISARLEQTVRNSAGFVSRLSGDEFVIVMEASIGPALDRICGSILEAVRQPIVFDSRTCEVTASLGGAVYPVHGADSRSLLIHADGAMYAAKKAGKNTALFSQKASIRATALVGELTRAIQNEEFELYYQPTIDALTGHIQGAEALVRWNHPVRGVLSPAEFIPAAEDLGLIHSLGDWILDQACMRLAEWHSRGLKYTMAVNLSAVQLQDEDFPGRAKAILDKHGIQPGQLVAEVTETFAITGMDACAKALQALRQLGVVIAMDDFGTGYSSLSHLHRLPVGELKIDRSFVNGLPRDKEAMRICEAIVALAHSLKIQVTAEGVETREQQTAVTEFGCDILQGYLFGRPMPWADFSARLERAALAVHPSTSQLAA
jgi:diguanylate cyclase (GGDEF)-like protein